MLLPKRRTLLTLSQEYYKEKDIREVYRSTIEKLLLILYKADERPVHPTPSWPPWPWPPWGPDEDKKVENSTAKATRISGLVLDFETEIADATLDL